MPIYLFIIEFLGIHGEEVYQRSIFKMQGMKGVYDRDIDGTITFLRFDLLVG